MAEVVAVAVVAVSVSVSMVVVVVAVVVVVMATVVQQKEMQQNAGGEANLRPAVFVFLHIWGSLSPGFHRPHTEETCCFAPPERVRPGSWLLERPDLRPPQPTSALASPNSTHRYEISSRSLS
jgi:hypothetical protein